MTEWLAVKLLDFRNIALNTATQRPNSWLYGSTANLGIFNWTSVPKTSDSHYDK